MLPTGAYDRLKSIPFLICDPSSQVCSYNSYCFIFCLFVIRSKYTDIVSWKSLVIGIIGEEH